MNVNNLYCLFSAQLLSADLACARYDVLHDALMRSPQATKLYNDNKVKHRALIPTSSHR